EAEALGAGVKFLDWPGEAAADKLLSSSHCLVYPSLVYENCPNAIQRALAAGLPVLASELGGIPELLSKNAGILFKPADVEKLAEKMEWIINNQENLNEIITAGKEKAALFRIDNYLKEILKLIA
ncbi:glycosyltransferase family 4 protein, partial [Candidatus Falkowbacteria bacterium]|nr:glycosyltransferase family 4 protein [Candidatus Falkowbacteria bacterium]